MLLRSHSVKWHHYQHSFRLALKFIFALVNMQGSMLGWKKDVWISVCECECKMNHGDGWAQASFSQSLLVGTSRPSWPLWLMMCLFHWLFLPHEGDSLQVASCTRRSQNSLQGRWCWTSKEYLWSGRTLVPLGPSLCPMCCTVLPSVTSKHWKEILQSQDPLLFRQQHDSSTTKVSWLPAALTEQNLMCYDTDAPSSSPTFCSCIASAHNCLFWGAGKHYFLPVWLLSVGYRKPTETLNTSVHLQIVLMANQSCNA